AHLHQQAHIEPEPFARFDYTRERCEVQAVLALVVGGAAAVPPVTLRGNGPWRQSLAPLRVVAMHDVAVTVREHRRQIVAFAAFGDEERRAPRWIVDEAPGKSDGLERRRDRPLEIRNELRTGVRALAFGAM